ncbi:hypothetical protein [Leptodesmis sp.]|uniref:hypothetical protein n=1 Tax=Leptodesmis sp. TaxID=3100501 RepID=UPI0040535522
MNKPLDEARSQELAQHVKSKTKATFDNAYRGALATKTATYVQGFLVIPGRRKPLEHAWLELDDCLIDPSLPYLNRGSQDLYYFPAQRLSVKQLKAAVEEAKEDYPEDPSLPIYGTAPYAYYGDLMLGGEEYQAAYQAAEGKCRELKQQEIAENN